jgi:hypothetical protein
MTEKKLTCDPLVERKQKLPGRPRGHEEPCNFMAMRVQVPPSRCRSDSISPRSATGPQGPEAGRNGGAWQPHFGYPVKHASLGSASQGVVQPSALFPSGRGGCAGAKTAQERAPAAVSTDRPALPRHPVERTALRRRALALGNGGTSDGLADILGAGANRKAYGEGFLKKHRPGGMPRIS